MVLKINYKQIINLKTEKQRINLKTEKQIINLKTEKQIINLKTKYQTIINLSKNILQAQNVFFSFLYDCVKSVDYYVTIYKRVNYLLVPILGITN